MAGFSVAFEAMKHGQKVTKEEWNGKGKYLSLSLEIKEFYLHHPNGDMNIHILDAADMLDEDWLIIM